MGSEAFLAVSDSEHGRRSLFAHGAHKLLLKWTADIEVVSVNALSTLVNLSADMFEDRVAAMLELRALDRIHEVATTPECRPEKRDNAMALLANMTTGEEGARASMQLDNPDPVVRGQRLRQYIASFAESGGVAAGEVDSWQHIGSVIQNISQLQEGRDLLRRRSTNLLPRLLPHLESPNLVRRRGVAAAAKNCCYETSDHSWLLHEVGIVPRLLLPLAGPEPLDGVEREGMDAWLLEQLDIAGEKKEREPNVDVRKTLLGAIQLLCTEKASRQALRKSRAYPIIKNCDTAEPDEKAKEIAFNIINFLVRDEEEGDNEDILGPSSGAAGGAAEDASSAEEQKADPTPQQMADRSPILKKDDEFVSHEGSAMNQVD